MQLPSIFNKRRTTIFTRLAFNGLAQAVATIITVLLVRMAFDRLITTTAQAEQGLILKVGVGLCCTAVALGWLQVIERVDAERMGQSYIHQIRMLLFRHMSHLDPRTLQNRSRGGIVLRFIGDLNALKRWVSLGLVRIAVAGITTCCALLAMAAINWRLAIAVTTVFGLGALYALNLGTRIRETSRESRRRRSYLAANVNEKVASMTVVQVFGQTVREKCRIKRQSKRLTNALIDRAQKIGMIRGMTQTVAALASGVVLLEGAREVGLGLTTPGTVVAAMTIIGLLVPALRDLSRVYEYWQDSRVSVEKLISFLETPSQTPPTKLPALKSGPGRLEFKDICFGNLLRNITVTAAAGSNIVIVGPNGAGKSTLISMAAKLVEADEGTILLDGQDISDHSFGSIRRAISIVSPDLPLLRGSVRKNLLYRQPDASAREIKKVWNLCGIDGLLKELPQGEDTRVTEEGNNLSLGQRQKISLARAFLGSPRILLLDEADAHLDVEAGMVLNRILQEYKGTILRVTHNPDLLAQADTVWRIEKGHLTIIDNNLNQEQQLTKEMEYRNVSNS
ncbi:MAG: ABC transporter ATP-binding protein [Thermodesulfobacteriota bacterium]|nr:ABC transporter ATP-binding protein [Thermodesulfobacteriota bacterium]